MSTPTPPYVMLSDNQAGAGGGIRPPPYRRNVPRYHSTAQHNHKSGGNCCLRCICFCYCFLFLLIIISGAVAFYFYAIYQPKMPSYTVSGMEVKAFNVQPDFSLYTEFLVTVKAENPNDNIGFIYGKASSVLVSYTDSELCSGKLPSFHQGHKNTTMIKVMLTGKSEFGSGLQEALMNNRNSGRIPLLVMVKAPVSVVVGDFPMRQFVVFVNCSLVVDNLSPNKKIGILSSKYSGTRAHATIFGRDIDVLRNTLTVLKPNYVRHASIRNIEPCHRVVPHQYQWILTSRTLIEDATDGDIVVQPMFNFVPFLGVAVFHNIATQIDVVRAIVRKRPSRTQAMTHIDSGDAAHG